VRASGSAEPERQPPAGAAQRSTPPSEASSASGRAELERLVSTFAESYLPASTRVSGLEETQAFLGRLAESLEAFARAFVEMRKGYEEFGKQMGVRMAHGDGPVLRARDPRQLIATLLDPAASGRASELQTAFADYMVHQVALLNGVVEGAKGILSSLSPDVIEQSAPQTLWQLKGQSLWKTFEERYRELFEEESAISDALFGRDFRKAYTAIVGRRGAPGAGEREEREEEEDDEDGDEVDEGATRRSRRRTPGRTRR
jgi:predicted component of type VI protein secretion system